MKLLRHGRIALLIGLILAPGRAESQTDGATGSDGSRALAEAETVAERLSALEQLVAAEPDQYQARWQLAREYMTLVGLTEDNDEKKEIGRQARGHAMVATVLEPGLIEGHYWLAVASGALADIEGGRTRVRFADESWFEATWVLAVDSTHAGAHHVKGRIHAGIMRASGFTRFIAKTLLGAEAIDRASWEMAEYHLGRAASLEPTPMHLFEFALMYGDTDRPDRMMQEMVRVVDAVAPTPLDEQYKERARRLLSEEGGSAP